MNETEYVRINDKKIVDELHLYVLDNVFFPVIDKIRNYLLQKKRQYYNFTITERPLKGIEKKKKSRQYKDEFILEILDNFKNVMRTELRFVDRTFFENNVESIEIYRDKFGLPQVFGIVQNLAGSYDPNENRIKLYNEDSKGTIYHELLHMASAVIDDKINFSGFNQIKSKDNGEVQKIGIGINEGYTDLLTSRYFVKDVAYCPEENIANSLEKLIGREKMEKFYFGADLRGLVEELRQYDTDENIMLFIRSMDYFTEFVREAKLKDKPEFEKIIKKNNHFLFKNYFKKIKNQLEKGEINNSEFLESLVSYYNEISIHESVKMESGFTSIEMIDRMKMNTLLNTEIEHKEVRQIFKEKTEAFEKHKSFRR